ncbi:hypothetical protein BD779DRAFT_1803631, partial [Infundibulicybe gibba]
MDVFSPVVGAIDLAEKLIGYVKAVKGAERDRLEVSSEVSALKTLLEIMRGRLGNASANDSSDDISNRVVKTGIEGSLGTCYGALKSAVDRLENLAPNVPNTREQFRVSVAEWLKNAKWPFHQGEIKTLLTSIERLKSLLSLALQTSLMEFIERARDELATTGRNVEDIKAAILLLEANQRGV